MENSQIEAYSPIDSPYDYESEDESSDDDVDVSLRQLADSHAQEHVWSQEGSQVIVQVPNSQPATQRGRGQRGRRGQRGDRDTENTVAGVSAHMMSTLQSE